ncbi:MAG: hypothetical protein CMH54_09790 [Myxococcales bacterium]|nr:hypothetical protein [Myxococcales bacterium]|tara:strand:+ start:1316 stop:1549 length:234 start_codon:yes stop_codon:yes gene_type:complete
MDWRWLGLLFFVLSCSGPTAADRKMEQIQKDYCAQHTAGNAAAAQTIMSEGKEWARQHGTKFHLRKLVNIEKTGNCR